jgi:hypothetical protein
VVGHDEDEVDGALMTDDLQATLGVVVEVAPDDDILGAVVEHEHAHTSRVVLATSRDCSPLTRATHAILANPVRVEPAAVQ